MGFPGSRSARSRDSLSEHSQSRAFSLGVDPLEDHPRLAEQLCQLRRRASESIGGGLMIPVRIRKNIKCLRNQRREIIVPLADRDPPVTTSRRPTVGEPRGWRRSDRKRQIQAQASHSHGMIPGLAAFFGGLPAETRRTVLDDNRCLNFVAMLATRAGTPRPGDCAFSQQDIRRLLSRMNLIGHLTDRTAAVRHAAFETGRTKPTATPETAAHSALTDTLWLPPQNAERTL